jgi:2-keto-3-deoxy-L-rhamnonate aldolase RhmA
MRRVPAARLNRTMNDATLVKVLIETPLGLENLASIAALPDVDLLGIGANDLTAELGVPGEYDHPEVRRALEGAIRICNQAGKPLAIGGIADPVYSAELISLGAAPFFFTGIDTEILLVAAQERVRHALASYNP